MARKAENVKKRVPLGQFYRESCLSGHSGARGPKVRREPGTGWWLWIPGPAFQAVPE